MGLTFHWENPEPKARTGVSGDVAESGRFPVFSALCPGQRLEVITLRHSLLILLPIQHQETQMCPTYLDSPCHLIMREAMVGKGRSEDQMDSQVQTRHIKGGREEEW